MYLRTNRVNYVEQVSQFQRRMDNMGRISERERDLGMHGIGDVAEPLDEVNIARTERDESAEVLEPQSTVGNGRYLISVRGTAAIDLPTWLMRYRFDPATQASHVTSR